MRKVFLLLTSIVLFAFSQSDFALSVGFENLHIKVGKTKEATYSFGDHAMIFCFEARGKTIGKIRWTYQKHIKNSTLPILLKVNPIFEGEFADANGKLEITNTRKTADLIVSCVFGF